MITADEIVAAGSGKYNTRNTSYYLYKISWYWSLSPNSSRDDAIMFHVIDNGSLINNNVYGKGGVAPVISLSAEYVKKMSGNGTTTSPYEVK